MVRQFYFRETDALYVFLYKCRAGFLYNFNCCNVTGNMVKYIDKCNDFRKNQPRQHP